jgi:hypothetical protein
MINEAREVLERGVSSIGRASALQAGGQGFKSPTLHKKIKIRKTILRKIIIFRWRELLICGVMILIATVIGVWGLIETYSGKRTGMAILITALLFIFGWSIYILFKDFYDAAVKEEL